jgi:hypothetical protein
MAAEAGPLPARRHPCTGRRRAAHRRVPLDLVDPSLASWQEPSSGSLTAPADLAADLAEFVIAFRAIDIAEAPRAYRGGSLARLDEQTRVAIAKLDGTIDTDAATAIWDEALDNRETWEELVSLSGRQRHLRPVGF